MTLAEIITAVISTLALIISGITAYFTLLARFHGHIIPRHRVILTQFDALPCLVLECEFINDGAKPGTIEDVLVRMVDEQGNRAFFTPYGTRDLFSIFQNYQKEDLNLFSGMSLGARQRREIFVAFRPSQPDFRPMIGEALLRMNVCTDVSRKKWKESIIKFSLDLKEENVREWISPNGKSQQLTAVEVGQSRMEFLHDNQR
jgi:hypothetical protein